MQEPRVTSLESNDAELEAVRMPPSLRGAYLLVGMSFVSGLATVSTVVSLFVFGATVLLGGLPVFSLLGIAMCCGAFVAGAGSLRAQDGRHAPLAAFVMVLAVLELLGWLLLLALLTLLLLV